jgi:TonB family protein
MSVSTAPGAADAAPEPEAAEVEDYAERVRLVVQSHSTQIERCYERAAKGSGPSAPLEGRIDLRFTLMPNGSAENVEVAGNSTGSAQLADCVAELFRSWSMPPGASRPIPLEWPVAFHPPA